MYSLNQFNTLSSGMNDTLLAPAIPLKQEVVGTFDPPNATD